MSILLPVLVSIFPSLSSSGLIYMALIRMDGKTKKVLEQLLKMVRERE